MENILLYLNEAIFRENVVITRCIILWKFSWKFQSIASGEDSSRNHTLLRSGTPRRADSVEFPRDGCRDSYLAAILIQFFHRIK